MKESLRLKEQSKQKSIQDGLKVLNKKIRKK